MHTAVSRHDEKAGLLYWAQRALEECDKASLDFAPEAVHDLRVALRRCRSMADGFLSVDPDPRWKQMKRLAKPLFATLGELRDTQVMSEWTTKLAAPDDQVRGILLETLRKREGEQRDAAQEALHAFDRKDWLELNSELAMRSQKVPLEGNVFQFVALERLQDARLLHGRAMRNRSASAYHQLRIGIKRFRYTVENFLPERHKRWSKDLRNLQDALGEIHDFDVLWATVRSHTEVPAEARRQWHDVLSAERAKRLNEYRAKMLGRQSLWHEWLSELPAGDAMEAASIEKLQTWASFLGTENERAKRTTELSLLSYDELLREGGLRGGEDARRILHAASILYETGRSKRDSGYYKRSYRMIRRIPPPLGWSAQQMLQVAVVARYAGGKLPCDDDAALAGMSADERASLFRLAGILRLCSAIEQHTPADAQISAQGREGVLCITVRPPLNTTISRAGESVARAKYLLEATCKIVVVIDSPESTSAVRTAGHVPRLE